MTSDLACYQGACSMRSLFRYIVLAVLLASGHSAIGAGLQVTPIVLDIKQTQKSDGLWLTNTSNAAMDVQVRVFEWVQNNKTDVLAPTTDFVASPPMAKIPGGGKQFVRLVKVGQPAVPIERSYRIVVDELPLESATSKGLTFALRYSIPVFIQAANAPTPPELSWHLAADPTGGVVLTVKNSGTTRAKLSDLTFTGRSGQTLAINKGLFGYALANSGRQWSISKNTRLFSRGGTFHAVMNGKTIEIAVPGIR
ncbi:fimbrial biogenesis chaperone [Advenella kashmirensis]